MPLGNIYNKITITLLLLLGLSISSNAQLVITPTATAAALAAKLSGPGVTIIGSSLTCNSLSNGTFVSSSGPITIDSGIVLSTGRAANAAGAEPALTSTSMAGTGDPDITASLLGSTSVSRDACYLVIDFIPKGDTVRFNYQFGSEEYRNSTCGNYNDAFAFFISGPGVSATLPGVNMAIIPGTTIPVTVNSINSGVPGPSLTLANCTAMGAGSPFTSYYVDNTGGTVAAYRGYTTVLQAKHWVIPCDTYRIKMSIVDAANYLYDSGVFIEAGSLKSNTYHFDHTDSVGALIAGTPRAIVKGCRTDTLKIKSDFTVPYPTTLYLSYGGSAVGASDYTSLPDSVIIPANDSVASIVINPLMTLPVGNRALNIYLTSSASCGIIDTFNVNILDHPLCAITTPDTNICYGTTATLQTMSTSGLTYNWTPAATLNNPTLAAPTTSTTVAATFVLQASLQNSGCGVITDSVRVSVFSPAVNIITPDTSICSGTNFQIRVAGSDSLMYTWLPGTGLSNVNVRQPIAFPAASTSYTVVATVSSIPTCYSTKVINVTVVPSDFIIKTHDSTYCEGSSIYLGADVTPAASTYSFSWTGPNGYSSSLQYPVIATADMNFRGSYIVTVTNMGLCSNSASAYVNIIPVPQGPILSAPLKVCQYSTPLPIQIYGYNNLMWYTDISDISPSTLAPVPPTDSIGTTIYYASQITFNSNCVGPKVPVEFTVESCCNGALTIPDAFTPNNDGINDRFRVLGSKDYAVSELSVFNRWGQQVYHIDSKGDMSGWDGTFNGDPCDMGTYNYIFIANCIYSSEKQIIKKGTVTLIR